jgi:hypothetical protein
MKKTHRFIGLACTLMLLAGMVVMAACSSDGGGGAPTGSSGNCPDLNGTWLIQAVLTNNSCPILFSDEELSPEGPVTITLNGDQATIQPAGEQPFTVQLNCTGEGFSYSNIQSDTDNGCTLTVGSTFNGRMTSANTFTGTYTFTGKTSGICPGIGLLDCTVTYTGTGTRTG